MPESNQSASKSDPGVHQASQIQNTKENQESVIDDRKTQRDKVQESLERINKLLPQTFELPNPNSSFQSPLNIPDQKEMFTGLLENKHLSFPTSKSAYEAQIGNQKPSSLEKLPKISCKCGRVIL